MDKADRLKPCCRINYLANLVLLAFRVYRGSGRSGQSIFKSHFQAANEDAFGNAENGMNSIRVSTLH